MTKFKGTGVALVTPLNIDGEIDFKSLERLVEYQINNGTNYLVVQGTTGESVTLSESEKESVLEFIIKVNDGRLPIVLGVGGNNTADVINQIKKFSHYSIDGILSVSPYYNKPSQLGIYAHYEAIAQCTELPIILYNVPGRTSSNISPETTLKLAKNFKNIVGIKEASGNLEQIMEIILNKKESFLVISGDDALTLPHLAVGGDGVISVVANAFPKDFSTMVNAAMAENMNLAREKHFELFEIIQYLFADGNPAGIKHVLKLMNICQDYVRLPLVNINDTTANKLSKLLATLKYKAV